MSIVIYIKLSEESNVNDFWHDFDSPFNLGLDANPDMAQFAAYVKVFSNSHRISSLNSDSLRQILERNAQ